MEALLNRLRASAVESQTDEPFPEEPPLPPLSAEEEKLVYRLIAKLPSPVFDPLSEKELDDLLEVYLHRAHAQGVPSKLLVHVIWRIGSTRVLAALDAIPRPVPRAIKRVADSLARNLFPFSREFRACRSDLLNGRVLESVPAAINEYCRVMERFDRLAKRWSLPTALCDEELQDALLCRVPQAVSRAAISSNRLHTVEVGDLGFFLQRIEDNLNRAIRFQPSLPQVRPVREHIQPVPTPPHFGEYPRPPIDSSSLPSAAPRRHDNRGILGVDLRVPACVA